MSVPPCVFEIATSIVAEQEQCNRRRESALAEEVRTSHVRAGFSSLAAPHAEPQVRISSSSDPVQ